MTEEQKRKIENRILILSLAVIGILAVIMVVLGVTHRADTFWFPLMSGIFLFIYWIVADVVSAYWLHSLDEKTEEQKKAYYLYAAADLAGLAGLVYFIMNMRSSTGVIVYVAAMFLKRKFHTDYEGVEETEEDESASEDAIEEAEIASEDSAGEAEIASEDVAVEQDETVTQ
jgi:hypothetical protein